MDIKKGDIVAISEDARLGSSGYHTGHQTYPAGTEFEVTGTGRMSRVTEPFVTGRHTGNSSDYVREIPLNIVVDPDPNVPKPRKLGEAPQGSIPIDDPRIAYIWDDAKKAATQAGYCSYYDTLVAKLGAPGPVKSWSVNRTIKGIAVTIKAEARTQNQADAIVSEQLKAAKVVVD